jgi:N-dimethylarginine dimethylaminohydrolase
LPLPTINSHNSWSQLQEVWLGDVYPASWYEHLESEVRDVFQQITEVTQQDLRAIQAKIEEFGTVVRRPVHTKIDQFIDHNDQLRKPQITPRDHFVTIGNTMYCHQWALPAWQPWLDLYSQDLRCQVKAINDPTITGANVVRVGRDIIVDTVTALESDSHTELHTVDWQYQNQWPEYRVQLEQNGGHLDGCFALLKPGLILANRYFDGYERTFPGWEVIMAEHPTYEKNRLFGQSSTQNVPVNGKFYDTAVGTNRMFNDHVVKHAQDWVGNYTETYFELNCLSIDESNVIMLADNESLAKILQQHGITVHWVPFRTRKFWDGAMHCLTVDIRRESTIEDFFPERG